MSWLTGGCGSGPMEQCRLRWSTRDLEVLVVDSGKSYFGSLVDFYNLSKFETNLHKLSFVLKLCMQKTICSFFSF